MKASATATSAAAPISFNNNDGASTHVRNGLCRFLVDRQTIEVGVDSSDDREAATSAQLALERRSRNIPPPCNSVTIC